MGSNLWLWQRAQPIVSPRKAAPVVSAQSISSSARNCSAYCLDSRASGPKVYRPVSDSSFQVFHLLERNGATLRQLEAVRPQLIPGDLLLHKAVVGFVVVEGLDHIVPVTPGVGVIVIRFIAAAVRIAHHIEPVSSPALSLARRVEQLCDPSFIGIGRRVEQEAFRLFRRWWETNEIEISPSDQRLPVGARSRLQAFFFQPGQNKGVNRSLNPAVGTGLWEGRDVEACERTTRRAQKSWQHPPHPRGRQR